MLLISMVSRAIIVRVQPDDLICFRVYDRTRQDHQDSEGLDVGAQAAASVAQPEEAVVSTVDMRMDVEWQESEDPVGARVRRLETVQWKDGGDKGEEEQTHPTTTGGAADEVPRQGFWSKVMSCNVAVGYRYRFEVVKSCDHLKFCSDTEIFLLRSARW